MERDAIEAAIRKGFAGVRLGSGVSLRQAEYIDQHYNDYSQAEYEAARRSDITDDWARIPERALVCDALGHLDAEGLRYYLPALMLWLLDHYNDENLIFNPRASLTAIGTMLALSPPAEIAQSRWDTFDGFTVEQRAAMAMYVEALPRLVSLDREDATHASRSMERYWARLLPNA